MHLFTHYCCVCRQSWTWYGTSQALWQKQLSPYRPPPHPSSLPVDHGKWGEALDQGHKHAPSCRSTFLPLKDNDASDASPPTLLKDNDASDASPPPTSAFQSGPRTTPKCLKSHQQLPLAWINFTSVSMKCTRALIGVSFGWIGRTIPYETWL